MRERTVLRCNDVVNDMRNDNGSRGNGFQPFNPPNRGRQQGGMRQSNFGSEQNMGYDNSMQFAGNACGFPPCSGCRCECTYYGATGPTGATAPSIYAQQGKCRNHAAFSTLKTIKQPL